MIRRLRVVGLILGLSVMGMGVNPADAWAGKSKDQITLVGIASFDEVFSEAKSVDDALTNARKQRHQARKNVNSVMGLDKKTAFGDALNELNQRANGKVKVAMKGNTPSLSVSDAVPTNVQEAIDAVNSAISLYSSLAKELQDVPPRCKAAVKKAKKLEVSELKDELGGFTLNISELRERIDTVKQFKTNLEVTAGLPKKAQNLISNLAGDVQAVSSVFPGL